MYLIIKIRKIQSCTYILNTNKLNSSGSMVGISLVIKHDYGPAQVILKFYNFYNCYYMSI